MSFGDPGVEKIRVGNFLLEILVEVLFSNELEAGCFLVCSFRSNCPYA